MENEATLTRAVLDAPAWRDRRADHERRVDAWVRPHLERRRRREAHPVEDFLFTYYAHRPAALRRWHPGYGVVLEEAEEYVDLKGYVEVSTGCPAEAAGATVARGHVLSQER
ncbi:MAG TPA: hypothetical protein VGD51_06795, partial [Nocardioidaceae bacterium]